MSDPVQQCGICKRYFVAGAVVDRPVNLAELFRLELFSVSPCLMADCAEVAAAAERRATERSRCGRRFSGGKPGNSRSVPMPAPVKEYRKPYSDPDLPEESAAVVMEAPAAAETARTFGQKAFEAEDAAASQNKVLLEFFSKPDNFGKWFSSTFLEEISHATRMNNRAIDLRKHFVPLGLYIDNYMIKSSETSSRRSHYRICRIADALSLTAQEKEKIQRVSARES